MNFVGTRSLFAAEQSIVPEYKTDSIILKYKNSKEVTVYKLKKGQTVTSEITHFQALSTVEYAEPNYVVSASAIPSDTYYTNQWYLQRIRAGEAWDINNQSSSIIIAIIDSGVQIQHPDLAPVIWTNPNEKPNNKDNDHDGLIGDLHGWDFVNNTADPSPKFTKGFTQAGITHGTIVAGIAAAAGNNQMGISGVTWKSQIMPIKVLDDKGNGDIATVIKGIDYATAHGANVINLSFVGFGLSRALEQAVARAHQAGVIIVAPAGNEQASTNGLDLNHHPVYPACFKDDAGKKIVVGVAATDALDQKTVFSGYGSSCIDIAAPGVSFFSTSVYAPLKSSAGNFFNQLYDGYWSGTSMAVPLVSGAIALVEGTNPSLSPDQALSIVLKSADNINALNPDYINQLGSGRLNLAQAVLQSALSIKNRFAHFALVPDKAATPLVTITDQKGFVERSFLAYPANFNGGVNLSSGDVNGDGNEEIITAPASNREADIKIFNSDGFMLGHFLAFPPTYRGGVNVAAADIDNDGKAEIIVTPSSGMEPIVKIYKADGVLIRSFLAYNASYRLGLSLAVADVIQGGTKEIIVAPSKNAEPLVQIFSNQGKLLSSFMAGNRNLRTGLNVAAADVDGNPRQRSAEILLSPSSGPSYVSVYDFRGNIRQSFQPYNANFKGNTRVIAADLNRDGFTDIITMPGVSGGPHIRIFNRSGLLQNSFYAYDSLSSDGVRGTVFLTK